MASELREIVRNYVNGMTCEEIEKEIAVNPLRLENRLSHLNECLTELEVTLNRVKADSVKAGQYVKRRIEESLVYVKVKPLSVLETHKEIYDIFACVYPATFAGQYQQMCDDKVYVIEPKEFYNTVIDEWNENG